MRGFSAADVPDQHGKCFIITGANAGIGLEAAKVLVHKGARVLLGCRDKAKADAVIAKIGGRAVFLPLNLADLASVRSAAVIAARERRIDALINNAGVMFPPLSRTAQGFELQWGVNHLGGFVLTNLLLPKLAETPGSRVVITASLAHNRGKIDWHDLDAQQSYKRAQRYADSKLANLLHMAELDRRLREAGTPVKAIACHPGVAATDLMRHTGPFRLFTPLLGLLLNTARKGAWPTLQAATDPSAESGDYYGPRHMGEMRGKSGKARRSEAALDETLGRTLWDVSDAATRINLSAA